MPVASVMSLRELIDDSTYCRLSAPQRLWAAQIAQAATWGLMNDLDALCAHGTATEVVQEARRRLLAARCG